MSDARRSARAELEHRLQVGTPLLLDGATGTELERRGVPTPAPLWSAAALRKKPTELLGIHDDYVEAGAEIIVANTFRTNPRTLRAAGWDDQATNLNAIAVGLAREAVAAAREEIFVQRWVAASVGPVEDCYRPELTPDERTLLAEHEQNAEWLVAAEPDLLWIETIGTLREARAVARIYAETGFAWAVCFVTDERGRLLSGEPLAEGVAAVERFDPIAIGLNCIPPSGLSANLEELKLIAHRPLVAYAHIGNAEPLRGWSYAESHNPAEYAKAARQWLDIGARVVGGCCGTTPDHIAAVRATLGGGE